MSQQFLPPGNKYTGSFTEDTEGDGVRLNAFNHEDADVAFDPLSANRLLGHRRLGGVGNTGVCWAYTGDDIGDGARLFDAAGERYGSSGFAPPCGFVAGTGGRHDQLVTRGSSREGFVSGVSG